MKRSAIVLACLLCLGSLACGVEPSLRTLDIRGLQIGATTEITCEGDDFTSAPRLLLPFAAQQELKPGNTDKKAAFVVTLRDDIEPGFYQLRIVTSGGVSLPLVIGVDRLPQISTVQPLLKLPVAVHGTVSGSTATVAKFTGRQGEAVAIEVEAQRLGSKLRPVIHLQDAKGKQLAWSWPKPELFGDARLQATLPVDGDYVVTCHDLEYAAPSPGFYRLKIGRWLRVDQVFPTVVDTVPRQIELLTSAGPISQQANASFGQVIPLPMTNPDFSGPRPFVRLSNRREMLEAAAAGAEQSASAAPLGISGKLDEPYQEDRYRLAVAAGEKLQLEVTAQRLGTPLDAVLLIRNEQGNELARAEDSPGTLDPVLEYTVPDKVTSLQIGVVDSQGRGGLLGGYHLSIRSESDTTPGDFRLLTNLERAAIPKGGRWLMPVWVDRRGYQGAIEISSRGLPAGLSLANNTIAAGADGTLVTLIAAEGESASDQPAAITNWHGKTLEGRVAAVTLQGHPLDKLQPWLAEEVALARVSESAAEFTIDWRNLPETTTLQPAAKLALPIKVTRAAEEQPVRLSLVTSQLVTFNNNQPDPRTTLRVERPTEIAVKQSDGDVSLLVPVELPYDTYEVAVRAELLSADKQKVLATAFTPVKRLSVQLPVELQLSGEPRFTVTLDPKSPTSIKVAGTVKRREGISGDVTLALTGLPNGVRADSPTVKAEASEFAVTITVPTTQAAGEWKGLKLSATIAPDPKQAGARVKSRDVPLELHLLRPPS